MALGSPFKLILDHWHIIIVGKSRIISNLADEVNNSHIGFPTQTRWGGAIPMASRRKFLTEQKLEVTGMYKIGFYYMVPRFSPSMSQT